MSDQQIAASFSTSIERDADLVWQRVKDFGDLSWAAAAGLGDVEVDGQGVGMIRTIAMPGSDAPIVERLVALSDDAMSITYVVDNDSLPGFKHYAATAQVQAVDAGALISWSMTARAPLDVATDMQAGLAGMAEGLVTLFAMQFAD